MSEILQVVINGDARQVPVGINVMELLGHLGLAPERVAIEHNLDILPRTNWDRTLVSEGDRFEIVHLVGGG
jgi:thiamine biosynthesis protein ThiS